MFSLKSSLILLLKPVLFTALALMQTVFVFAQTQNDGELIKSKLANSEADINRADLLIDLGTYYLIKLGELKTDMDSAMLLKQQALVLSKKLNYTRGIAKSMLLEGKIYHEKGDEKRSLVILRKTINYCNFYHLYEQIGEVYREMGFHLSNDDFNIEKKISYHKKAAEYFEKASSKMLLARSLEMLGDLYQYKDDYDTAIPFLKRSIAISDSIGDKDTQGVYNLLGYIYYYKQNNFNALKNLQIAVKIAQRQKDHSLMLAVIYIRLASVYVQMQQYDNAIIAYGKGLEVAEMNHDANAVNEIRLGTITTLRNMKKYKQALAMLKSVVIQYPDRNLRRIMAYEFCNIYLDLERYKDVRKYVDTLHLLTKEFPDDKIIWLSFNIVSLKYHFFTRQFKSADLPLYSRDAAEKMKINISVLIQYELYWSKIDSALGNDPSSLKHYKIYKTLNDSIVNQRNSKQMSELQLQYDTENKDQNIRLLTQQSQLQKTEIHNQEIIRNVFIGGVLVLLVFSGLMYSRYLLKQRANEKLAIKQEEINGQNVILQKLLDEKEWLLKEIHHRVKNNLQIVISLLNSQSAFLENEDALAAIQNSQHRMHAMSLIHQKLYQSENMGNIDMHWYIHELVNYMRESFNTDRKISFTLDVNPVDLDVAQAVPLGLILNEAITNSIKYAFPENSKGKVSISLKQTNEAVCVLDIADNGIGLPAGFDLNTIESLGMSLMQGLSEQLDGSLLVNSDAGLILTITFKKNRQLVTD
ncbi:tetratricopeptide repeat protein [Dyadobacter sp. 3J3]|uniref:tetratricopeptide repeat-containing sensor histidine kinase n=1 Tax=Dyadobacter sp. 3J3 TaxID=2606600 RepID=UPI0013582B69|nr:tetratricopeptide repeat protein [Dyadobacter sp. 3J3]